MKPINMISSNISETPKQLLNAHQTTSDYLFSFAEGEQGLNVIQILPPHNQSLCINQSSDSSIVNRNISKQVNTDVTNEQQIKSSWQKIQNLVGITLKSTILFWLNMLTMTAFLISCSIYDPVTIPHLKQLSEIIQINCQIFFCTVIVLRLINRESQFVAWTILQILLVGAGFAAMTVPVQMVKYFKAIRALRLAYFIGLISALTRAAQNLVSSLSNVKKIILPAAVFIYIFAIIGIHSFSNYQYNRCRTPDNKLKTQNWTVYQDKIFLCGIKECPIVNGTQLQCLNPIDYGVQPNPNELHKIELGYGLLKYDNVLSALLSTYKQIFVTGSSRLMVLYKQATYELYIYFYYLSFIYLLSYVYLNIFFGLMLVNETSREPVSSKQLAVSSCESALPIVEIKPALGLPPIEQQATQNQYEQVIKLQQTPSQEKKIRRRQLSPIKRKSKNHLLTTHQFEPVLNFSQAQSIQQEQNHTFNEAPLVPVVIDKKTIPKKDTKIILQKTDQLDTGELAKKIQQSQPIVEETFTNQEKSRREQCLKILVTVSNFFIVVGCLNMCMDFKGKSQHFTMISDTIDVLYTLIFAICFTSKVIVFTRTPPEDPLYIQRKYDIVLQFMILLIAIGGLIYEAIIATDLKDFLIASGTPEKIIRTVKYLRIFSFMLRQPSLNEPKIILYAVINVIKKIVSVIFLYALVVLIFAIVGFHLFGYTTKIDQNGWLDLDNGKPFQVSFDGIYNSIIFIFLTFYNQQWDYFMFEQSIGNSYFIVVWQLISITFGCLILSKYFMTLLMKELSDKLDQQRQQFLPESQKKIQDIQLHNLFLQENEENVQSDSIQSQLKDEVPAFIGKIKPISQGEKRANKRASLFKVIQARRNSILSSYQISLFRNTLQPDAEKIQEPKPKVNIQILGFSSVENTENKFKYASILKKSKQSQNINEHPNILSTFVAKSAYFIKNVLQSKYHVAFRSLILILKCISLIMDHPHLNPDTQQVFSILILQYISQIYFAIQVVFSIFAFGVWKEKCSYFRRSWLNTLYLILSIIGIASLIVPKQISVFYKISKITVLRVLIFLEMRYDSDKNMRLTIVAFTKLIPKFCSLFFVTITIFAYFAIILIRLYKQDFFRCINAFQIQSVFSRQDCYNNGGDWIEQSINVSNLGGAILYLFLVAATQGWSFIILPVANMRGANLQPLTNNNPAILFFFMIFFFIGNLIILNVFIGLSVYNFKKIKQQTTGQNQLLPYQRQWLSIKMQIYMLQPQVLDKEPTNIFRRCCYIAAKSLGYKIYRGILFILYLIIMSLMTSNMHQPIDAITSQSLKLLSLLVIPQYFIQVLAYGIRKDYKRKFFAQTFILIYTISILILTQTAQIEKKLQRVLTGLTIAFQFFRYFALLNQIPFFGKILNSIVTVIPKTFNILMIILATFFVYAVIGIQLFAYLRPGPELNEFDQNYQTFSSSIFALIKFSLWESPINQIIDAGRTLSSDFICFDILSYQDFEHYGQMGCGGKYQSYFFFMSFHLIYSLILMPTMMAVIFDTYSQVIKEQECLVNKFQLQDVKELWKNYDPQATGYISYRDFWMFTSQLMRIYKAQHKSILNESKHTFLKQLAIPIYEDEKGTLCFQFHEVIQSLTRIIIKKTKGKSYVSSKADKIITIRQSIASDKLKRSQYNSAHVLTLIILKSGLRVWNKKSHKKNVLTIFSNIKLLNKQRKPQKYMSIDSLNQPHQQVESQIQSV